MNKLKTTLFAFIVLTFFQSNAQSWIPVADSILSGGMVTGFDQTSSGYVISTQNGIYKSYDNGVTWQQRISGVDPLEMETNQLARLNSELYFSSLSPTMITLYKSSDEGESWTEVATNGLPSSGLGYDFFSWNNYLYTIIGTDYYRSNDGINWNITPLEIHPANDTLAILNMPPADSILFLNQSYDTVRIASPFYGAAIQFENSTGYAYSFEPGGNIYRADMHIAPVSWQLVSQIDFQGINFNSGGYLMVSGNNLLVTMMGYNPITYHYFGRIFQSSDNGASWQLLPTTCGLPSSSFVRFYSVQGDTMAVSAEDTRLYFSTDGGVTWTDRSMGIFGNYMGKIFKTTNMLVAKPLINGLMETGVVRSVDGIHWEAAMSGIPEVPFANDTIYYMPPRGFLFNLYDTLFFVAYDINKFYKSFDEGLSWLEFPDPAGNLIACLYGDENSIFLARDAGIDTNSNQIIQYLRSDNFGYTWTSVNSLDSLYLVQHSFAYVINGQHDTLLSVINQQPYYSTDNGDNWQSISSPVGYSPDRCDIMGDGRYIVGDFGATSDRFMMVFMNASAEDSLFQWQAGVWTHLNGAGLPSGIDIKTIEFDHANNIWLLTSDMGLFESSDDGANWTTSVARIAGGGSATVFDYNDQLLGKSIVDVKRFNSTSFLSLERNGIWYFDQNAVIGLNDRIHRERLVVYPNPSSTQIALTAENVKGLRYTIYNYLGHICRSGVLTSDTSGIYVHDMAAGVYILKLSDNRSTKFIVTD